MISEVATAIKVWIVVFLFVTQYCECLTFRNPASYIYDGHTATHNTPHFLYFFQQKHVLNFLNLLHTLHFFLFKMPFIS
jgi:hypothetical protein